MATLQELESLARRIVGRRIKVEYGKNPQTDGESIITDNFAETWPDLPAEALDDMDRFVLAHEARHIWVFEREARKRGLPSMSATQFYEIFADPFSPGTESTNYVRMMMNVVEDQLVDDLAAKDVGENRRQNSNRHFVWNRQGDRRPSLAEYESRGNPGMCAAFLEAIFQIDAYGQLIESFFSPRLETAASEAVRAIQLYGQGSVSRTQALERVLQALAKYCPPPWTTPEGYQSPKGEGVPGAGEGEGEGAGEGSGDGSGEGVGKGAGEGEGKESEGKPEGEPKEGNSSEGKEQTEQDAKESDASGNGTPQSSNNRGTGAGEGSGDPKPVAPAKPPRIYDEPELEAFYRALERIITQRSKETGQGQPRYDTWTPGDVMTSPEEHARYLEDDTYGIDPTERRAVRYRDQDEHLIAIFIDSSGSVDNALFAKLYRVIGRIADKLLEHPGFYLGVGQFSGGAAWVLEPTRDVNAIREFAEQAPRRLFSGGTVVGEIYKILPEHFARFKKADMPVLTDGYHETGAQLAASLEAAHNDIGCEIKLHGMVFKKRGSIKYLEQAKEIMPQHVRVWHLG